MRRGNHLLGIAIVAATVGAAALASSSHAGGPPELGDVAWIRDHDAALARARAESKPVFALFQEVPGCQTCVSFGDRVLSHPLLVEAIETEFVPLAIYNNLGGADAAALRRYGEPSWNNPVVRLLDDEGRDLLPRAAGVWEPGTVGRRMILALKAANRPVPAYLALAVDELGPHDIQRATFGMHCFWSGEACLGRIPGLLSSRAGFLGGGEVVEVAYDAGALSYEDLLREVSKRGCSERVYPHSKTQERLAHAVFGGEVTPRSSFARSAPESDQKRSLRATDLRKLALTPRQEMRINAAIAAEESPLSHLSPRQRRAALLDAPG